MPPRPSRFKTLIAMSLLMFLVQPLLLPAVLQSSRAAPSACGNPAAPIHAIQGAGSSSPLEGNPAEVEAVVVGDFQGSSGLNGFFLQEEDADADADLHTSEGLFVYDAGSPVDVSPGDVVRVQGEVGEYFGLTELKNVTEVLVCGTGAATPASVSLPVAEVGAWEAFEGMAVTLAQPLFVTENFNLGRYGEVDLAAGGRLPAPNHIAAPGTAALAQQDLNARSRIQLDDGSNVQNPLPLPPYVAADGTLRTGDRLDGLSGVLGYAYGTYEIHPTGPVSFTRENARPAAPPAPAPGELKITSFNVLNYFTTLDDGTLICGPAGGLACRGADTPEEFARQRAKLVSALADLDADVAALVEIENNPSAAVADLVAGLNDALGPSTYAYLDTGTIGTDAIKVALVYQPARVSPVGDFAILDSSFASNFIDTLNRPSLAQTFQAPGGERFTLAVNHFKSKGSSCDYIGDPDTGDGQGNCNLTRTAAALVLADWLATDPTGSGDPDFLILGDLNAYAKEDPIAALQAAGFTDMLAGFVGDAAYSYVFDGGSGYLDHAMASPSLAPQVRAAAEWHINADEPSALDYNDYNQPLLYQPDAFRAADHDPLVVYLRLGDRQGVYLPVMRR